jgi:site-specific DNA-cytosine methylase
MKIRTMLEKSYNEPFINVIDLFSGILGFTVAGERNGNFKTIVTSEIDPYNAKLIDGKFGLDNAGDVNSFGVPESEHPYSKICEKEDVVPCEETGFSSICFEDFMEGALEWPRMATGGFPCQDITAANTHNNSIGIDGERSGLVFQQLRILDDFELDYALFENAEMFLNRGLDRVLIELNDMGYIVEWGVISATAFGYPHYRHRTYVIAYKPHTALAKLDVNVFDLIRAQSQRKPKWIMPLLDDEKKREDILKFAIAEEPRLIKLRTKRINGLGNSVVPDIPEAFFNVISDSEQRSNIITKRPVKLRKDKTMCLVDGHWETNAQFDLFDNSVTVVTKMPTEGKMFAGIIEYSETRCDILNPVKTRYPNLYSTLISRDGNNNFTSNSRMSRPGKLGGLIGDLQSVGAEIGGLHPNFAEKFMGYSQDHTLLA